MSATQDLFTSQPPPGANTTQVGDSGLPQWYRDYIQGTAGKAVDIGNQMLHAPIPQQGVAGFNNDQLNAFQGVNNNQGSWKPAFEAGAGVLTDSINKANKTFGNASSALGGVSGDVNGRLGTAGATLSGVMGSVNDYIGKANTAVAGQASQFPDNFSKYMSPYTMGVVNEIGRLGNQNFSEKIMPQINADMIGSGQYGSERNADVLGRAARDAQLGISGQQAQALESGYGVAGNLFTGDANRKQQQQKMQGDTALQGAATAGSTGVGVGNAQGALAQIAATTGLGIANAQTNLGTATSNAGINQTGALTTLGKDTSALGYTDAGALNTIGNQQQTLSQLGLDTAYNNEVNAQNHDLNTLNKVNDVIRGIALPTAPTQITNAPVGTALQPAPITTGAGGINTATGH